MSNSTITIKDANAVAVTMAVDLTAGITTPFHLEDAGQRAALLSALAPLAGVATASGQSASSTAIVNAIGSAVYFPAVQPISATALPLPTGAATAAGQSTANTSLATISNAVTGTLTVTGPLTSGQLSAAALATAANQSTTNTALQSINNALTGTLAISASSLPLATGAATAANQNTSNLSLGTIANAVTGTLNVNTVQLPTSVGAKAAAASLPVTLATDGVYFNMQTTANNSLAAIANSVSGTVRVDTVIQAVAASRSGTITAGGTAQTLLAANPSRRGFVIQNNSSAPLYVNGLGAATSDGLSLTIAAGAYYESAVQHCGTAAVSILGATTGQAFYSREF